MWRTIVRRLIILVPQLIVISLVMFILADMMPGDGLTGLIGPNITGAELEELRELHGLNDPWFVRYTRWISDIIFRWEFGRSMTLQRPVLTVIGERAANTFWLSLVSTIFTFALAVPLGIIGGRYNRKLPDKVIDFYIFVAMAMPVFVLGILMIWLFALTLGLFPMRGSQDVRTVGDAFATFVSRVHHLILPSVTAALINGIGLIFFLRSEIVENSSSDYVLTARSKGVPERVIFSKHILRNSLIPFAQTIGLVIVGLLTGAIFLERIFQYPGMGTLFIDSVTNRDFPVANVLIIFFSFLTVVGILLGDIALMIVDPRIRVR